MNPIEKYEFLITNLAGKRLDQALVTLLPEYSRSLIQQWITAGEVTVNGTVKRASAKLKSGDKVMVQPTIAYIEPNQPQAIPLNIIFEDAEILVINKPAGMVVHPAAGHQENTLVNAILYHVPQAQQLPRGGLIHRLDKDTSGLLLIAKTVVSYTALVQAMQQREIDRYYQALVYGEVISSGTINAAIARHPVQRKKMAVHAAGKPAITHYRILKKYPHFTLLAVKLETGRTHQIRVHLSHIGLPIVGDKTYGKSLKQSKFPDIVRHFPRQALHAYRLCFQHPKTHAVCDYTIPLPDDIQELLNHME